MEPQAIVLASQLVARGRQPAEPSTLAKQADLLMTFQDLPGDSLRGFNLGFEFQDPFETMSLIVQNLDIPAAIRPMVWPSSIGEFFDGISPEEIRSGFSLAVTPAGIMAVRGLQVLRRAGLCGDEGAVQDIVGVGAAHQRHRLVTRRHLLLTYLVVVQQRTKSTYKIFSRYILHL